MALITCPSCQQNISELAVYCPKCGWKKESKDTSSNLGESTVNQRVSSREIRFENGYGSPFHDVKYDSEILFSFAQNLYNQAKTIIITSVIFTAITFGIIALILFSVKNSSGVLGFLLGAIIGAIIGFIMAQPIAFILKVKAQEVLCQVQIEKNTRFTARSLSSE